MQKSVCFCVDIVQLLLSNLDRIREICAYHSTFESKVEWYAQISPIWSRLLNNNCTTSTQKHTDFYISQCFYRVVFVLTPFFFLREFGLFYCFKFCNENCKGTQQGIRTQFSNFLLMADSRDNCTKKQNRETNGRNFSYKKLLELYIIKISTDT